MRLKVERVGGMLPTLRPSRTWDLADLDGAVRAAVLAFVRGTGRSMDPRHPDAMSYVFELDDDGKVRTASASFDDIPAALRALLPGPK